MVQVGGFTHIDPVGAPAVVLAWGVGELGLLTIILAFYGGGAAPLGLFGGSMLVAVVFGLAAQRSSQHHPLPARRYRVVPGAEAAVALAIACVFGGLVVVFGSGSPRWWRRRWPWPLRSGRQSVPGLAP